MTGMFCLNVSKSTSETAESEGSPKHITQVLVEFYMSTTCSLLSKTSPSYRPPLVMLRTDRRFIDWHILDPNQSKILSLAVGYLGLP